MATFSSYGGVPLPGTPVGGFVQGGIPSAIGFRSQGGVGFDADPITPGNQTTPGVVTATGPSRFVSGGAVGGIQGGIGGAIPGGINLTGISTGHGFSTGIGLGGMSAGGVIDADPITPGIQSQPGVVTPIGSPRIVSGPGAIGGGMIGTGQISGGMIGGRISQGGMIGGMQGGVIDADPITPGIQSQPGVVTPIGPPRIVSGPTRTSTVGFGGQTVGYGANYATSLGGATRTFATGGQIGNVFTGGAQSVITRGSAAGGFIGGIGGMGGVIDADPITPGIQSQPGVVTPIGPPRVISGPTNMVGGINTTVTSGIAGGFGVVDADPITPGIQNQPGVVTPVGPPVVVSGGAFNSGIATGFGGSFDADPITPGIQSQAGIVTQTGPTTVISSGFRGSGAIMTSGYQRGISTGIAGGMISSGAISGPTPMLSSEFQQNIGGLIDADPITPGIQLQPGTFTATGATMLSSGIGMGGTTFQTAIVDADPITPGIQAQAGFVTQTGPTTVVSGGNVLGSIAGIGGLTQSIGGVYDADPITPGIQSQPGMITPIGAPVVVGHVNQGCCANAACLGSCLCCPWWLWPLLGLILLGALTGGLYSCFKPKSSQNSDQDDRQQRNVKTQCVGYLNSKGNCIACPQGSEWNGKTCTYTAHPVTVSQKTTVTAEQGQTPQGNELPSSIGSSLQNTAAVSSTNKKVAVFAEQGQQAINGVLKGVSSQAGFAPTVVTSKPTPSTPSSVIDAGGSQASTTAQSAYTSTNVVKVPAIIEKKSVAPTISYSSRGSPCSTCGASGFGGDYYQSNFSSSSSGSSNFSGSKGSSSSSTSSSDSSSSSTSGSSGSTGGSSSASTTKTIRKITRTITFHRNEAVDPISAQPLYKHLKRQI